MVSATVLISIFVLALATCANGATRYTCENYVMRLSCKKGTVLAIYYANYGRTNSRICGRSSNTRCRSRHSLRIVSNRCNGKRSCTVPAKNSVFGDPCFGTYKYLHVVYFCVRKPSNVVCEHAKPDWLWLRCKSHQHIYVSYATYGRRSRLICPGYNTYRTISCRARNSNAVVKARCDARQTCWVAARNSMFGDPCKGVPKYLQVYYSCVPRYYIRRACEGRGMWLTCRTGYVVKIRYANYGRTSNKYCTGWNTRRIFNCRARRSFSIVYNKCKGKRFCYIRATNAVFGDPCKGYRKYLEVYYYCAKK